MEAHKNIPPIEKKHLEHSTQGVSVRGRVFEGIVTKKFPKRVVVERERIIYIPKYERFQKKKTSLHARLPTEIDVNVGDIVRIQECRPLSKIIHHIVIRKIKSVQDTQKSGEVKET